MPRGYVTWRIVLLTIFSPPDNQPPTSATYYMLCSQHLAFWHGLGDRAKFFPRWGQFSLFYAFLPPTKQVDLLDCKKKNVSFPLYFSSLLCIEQSFEVEGKNIFDRTRDQMKNQASKCHNQKCFFEIFLRRNSKKVALHHAWWQFLKEGRKLQVATKLFATWVDC